MRVHYYPVLIAVVAAGCNSGGGAALPTMHPVKGQILRGTEPVTGGYLTLRSDAHPGLIVTARVEADGRFEAGTVDTRDKDGKRTSGAPEGTYRGEYAPPGTDQNVTPITLKAPLTIVAGPNDLTIDLGKK